MQKVTVGNVEIVALLDADFGPPFAGAFPSIDADAWGPYKAQYPRSGSGDSWQTNAQAYLLRSDGETLLVDTGLGPGPHGEGEPDHLLDELGAAGVAPEDVQRVIFSHLHGDHVGWTVRDGELVFPNARHLVPEADWTYFRDESRSSKHPHLAAQVEPLETKGAMELVSGEQDVTSEVSLMPTPGHTPGHQSIVISSGGERAVLISDVAHHPAQLHETDWCAGFDEDSVESVATRAKLFEQIEADGSLVAACHFPHPGFGHFVRVEGKRVFRAL